MTANTSVYDLAQQIRGIHGIATLDAAIGVVTVHVEQISDDPDLWDETTSTITPAGVELVKQAVAETYNIGGAATGAQQLLADLADTVAELDRLAMRRDELIRAALRTELRRDDIADAAGVTLARLYQIRDGRR